MQSDGHGNFGINVDTYETYFDTLDISFSKKLLSDYLKQKKHKFEELKDIYENQKIDCLINNNQDSSVFIADDYQLPFEQIIAHEAFHVYQILTSSVLAEYSFYKRRVGFWKYYAVDLLIREKLSFNRGKSLLSVLHSNCDSDPDPELSKFIKDIIDKDEKEVNGEGFIGIKNGEEFSLLDIVEGAAVRFQYISQEDFKEKKVALTTEATKYTATWEYFLSKAGIDREVSSNFISAQFVFIYLSDIFLKFYDIYFYSTREFTKFIELAIPLIHFYEGYFIEFEDSEDRDFLLIKNIKQIEISPQNINSILEYCGTLSYDSQRVFFANIRLYAELFKRLTHAGSTTRELPTTNKNYAINRKLKEIFPYWNSHFTLPCVLSSYKEIAKFSTMWTHIDSVRYIDDFGNREITKEQEGYILNFVKRFEPLVNNKQDEVFCCAEHGNVRKMIKTIRTCQNSNSLNIIFKNIFGKELSEITINK